MEKKIEHLILVLRAIRRVNELITRENGLDRLLQGVCDNLIENRGYHNAWVVLLDPTVGFLKADHAGLGRIFWDWSLAQARQIKPLRPFCAGARRCDRNRESTPRQKRGRIPHRTVGFCRQTIGPLGISANANWPNAN